MWYQKLQNINILFLIINQHLLSIYLNFLLLGFLLLFLLAWVNVVAMLIKNINGSISTLQF